MVVTAEHRAFWSIQPLSKPALPTVRLSNWPKTDIDRFILARLEKEGLRRSAPPTSGRCSAERRST